MTKMNMRMYINMCNMAEDCYVMRFDVSRM